MSAIHLSRRAVLRRAAAAGLLAAPAAGLLSACGRDPSPDPGRRSRANPLRVDEAAALEVVVVNDALGEEYARAHEALYKARHPKAEIRHSATQEVGRALRPRFADGSPPDVVHNSGPGQLDVNELVARRALADLTELLDAPSLDVPGRTVRETLLPGTVEAGSYDGTPLVLNYARTAYGIWYSRRLFEDRGWRYPRTWDEHIALCRTIRAAGTAPWTYAGTRPHHMSWPLLATAVKFGGADVAVRIDNLEPNAWKSDAMRTAVQAWHQIVRDGYLLPGSAGQDHRRAQAGWCRGRAAFISCGSWLEHEQRAVTPPGFAMSIAPTPSLGSGDALPFEAIRVTAGEPFLVPAAAANRAGGLEYLRVMLSGAGARAFTEQALSLTVVAGAADGLDLPAGLASVVRALDASGPDGFDWAYPRYYATLERDLVGPACGLFFAGEIGPTEFLDRCQRGADEIARDDTVRKFRRTG